MSVSLERRLLQDRALRDAARELVRADLSHVKADLSAQGLVARFATRMSEGAAELYEGAVEVADSNRGVLVALMSAVVLWFARNPILSLLLDEDAADGEEAPLENSDGTRSAGPGQDE